MKSFHVDLENGSVTARSESGKPQRRSTISWQSQFDADGVFLGGVETRGAITTIYDKDWKVVGRKSSVGEVREVKDDKGIVNNFSSMDSLGKTIYYDLNGHQSGWSFTTSFNAEETAIDYYDNGANWIRSFSSDSAGSMLFEVIRDDEGKVVGSTTTYFDVHGNRLESHSSNVEADIHSEIEVDMTIKKEGASNDSTFTNSPQIYG